MKKLIIEHLESGVFVYEENKAHYRITEKQRKKHETKRATDSVADNCRLEVGEYIVYDLDEV